MLRQFDGWYYHHHRPNQSEIEVGNKLLRILKINKEDIIFNDRRIIYPYELDIWIPNLNMAFEYEGSQHFQSKNQLLKETTELKKHKCYQNNIKFTRIFCFSCGEQDIRDAINRKFDRIWERYRKRRQSNKKFYKYYKQSYKKMVELERIHYKKCSNCGISINPMYKLCYNCNHSMNRLQVYQK